VPPTAYQLGQPGGPSQSLRDKPVLRGHSVQVEGSLRLFEEKFHGPTSSVEFRRLLAMGRAEAPRVALPWATVKRWKKRPRDGLPLENGHGGRALARLKAVLLAGGT